MRARSGPNCAWRKGLCTRVWLACDGIHHTDILAFARSTGDLTSIYKELKSLQLRTMNRERAEMLAERWLASGSNDVATAAQVYSSLQGKCWPSH